MAVNFTGKWKEVRAENKEGILEAMGLPAEVRQKFASEKSTLVITHDGDSITTKELGEDGKVVMENSGKIGVPFTPNVPEGVPPVGELICTWEEGGKVFRTKPTNKNEKMPVSDMKIVNGELVHSDKLGDVTSTIYYAKV